MIRFLILCSFIFAVLMWSAAWGQSNAQVVSIPDANLRAVLEDSLGKTSGAPITDIELAQFTRLIAPDAGIVDLTGLEFATGLTLLHLGINYETWSNSNDISDLTPLRNLISLTVLNLSGNSITDVSPLEGLTNLTVLLLDENSITDVSPLGNLTNLTILGLSFNPVQDASSIRELETRLTRLTLPILIGTGIRNHPELDSVLNSMVRDYEFSLTREGSKLNNEPPPWVIVVITTETKGHIDSIVRFLQENEVPTFWKSDVPGVRFGYVEVNVPVTLLIPLTEQPGVRNIRWQSTGLPATPSGITGMSWGSIKARHKP